MSCHHCGQTHAEGVLKCPQTGALMSVAGLVGQRVDRYLLERLLGTGGFGTVYRARHVHTDATVALKLLKKELGADQSMLDRFMREAKAAGSVGNEHIVGILDAGVTDGQAFLALEFLDGWDLKDLVYREGSNDPQRLIAIVIQVLQALSAAHAKGIVHRDMKPANVFVVQKSERDFVKVLDFGISKMQQDPSVGGLTQTGMAMGTPTYMAPEQFFDAKNVDGRADLYSVAVMLYELLAKRLPFETQSYAELVVKVRTEIPVPLASVVPSIPAAVCAVVDMGLARDPAQRWQSAQQMAEALRAANGPGWMPVQARATPLPATVVDTPSMLMGATAPPQKSTQAVVALQTPTSFGPATAAPLVPMTPSSFGPPPVVAAPVAPPAKSMSAVSVFFWIIIAMIGSCLILGLTAIVLDSSGR